MIHNGINADIFSSQDTSRLRELHQIKPDERIALSLAPDFMNENNIALFILLITDILENNSQIIVLGNQEIAEKAFNVKLENNMAFLKRSSI